MMNDWIFDQLSGTCEIEYGTRVVRKKDAGTKFPVYGGGGATFSMDTYNRENRMVIARFAMSEKCTRFVKGKFFLNDSGLTLTALDKAAINERFLNYQILSLNDEIYALGRGTAQKNLNMEAFKKITLAYPKSLSEQKQIVSLLDEAFEKIEQAKANIEKNIENTKELFQSKLNEYFSFKEKSWEEKTLSEVCEITSKLVDPQEERFNDYIHVGGGNIVTYSGELIDLKTAKEEGLRSGKFEFGESEVLYNKIRPYLVKVVRPSFRGLCSADMYPLTPIKDKVTRDFLYYLLISNGFTKYAINGSARAGMPKVNREHLFNYRFCCPPIEYQIKVAENMDAIRTYTQALEMKYKSKLDSLEELKKTILQKAFSGELTNKAQVA